MPVGSPPPNTTKVTAAPIYFNKGNFSEITSWWPYGDVFIPPGQPGHQVPEYFDLWFKFQPGVTSPIHPEGEDFFSITVWNGGGSIGQEGTYYPGIDFASVVTVYKEDDSVICTGRRVQFFSEQSPDWLYVKVHTPMHSSIAQCAAVIEAVTISKDLKQIRRGSIYIQNHNPYSPLTVIQAGTPPHPASTWGAVNAAFAGGIHQVGGHTGDILPDGITCILDTGMDGVSVRDRNFRNPTSFQIGTSVLCIKRNGNGKNFWISYLEFGSIPRVRSLTATHKVDEDGLLLGGVDAELGQFLGINTQVRALCARDDKILFYSNEGDNIIRRWDIDDNKPLPDFAPYYAGIDGPVTDILVVQGGDVLVGYTVGTGIGVRKFNGTTGEPIWGTPYGSINQDNRINFGDDPDHFFVLTHDQFALSSFRKVRVDYPTTVHTTQSLEFEIQSPSGSFLIYDHFLYAPDRKPVWQPPAFAGTRSYSFFVAPLTTDAGMKPPDSNYGTPPTDEYFPDINFPPYPFPPDPNEPVLPLNTPGGGLLLIDPHNVTRHDVFQNSNNEAVTSPIKVTIRTAFIGE